MILNRSDAARVSTIQIIFKPPQYLEHGIVSRRELMAEPLFNRLESSGPDRQPACQTERDTRAGSGIPRMPIRISMDATSGGKVLDSNGNTSGGLFFVWLMIAYSQSNLPDLDTAVQGRS